MSKVLAFVFSKKDFSHLPKGAVIYFPLSTEALEVLIREGKDYQILEDFFPKGKNTDIFEISEKLSFDMTHVRVRSLSALSLSMNNYLAKRLFYLASLDSVFSKLKPSAVYIGREENSLKTKLSSNFDNYSPIIRTVCKKYRVPIVGGRTTTWFFKFAVQFLIMPKVERWDLPRISKDVIVFAANTYHVENCLPLIRQILKEGRFEPLVIGKLGNVKNDLQNERIKNIDYKSCVEPKYLPYYLFEKFYFLVHAFFYKRKKIDFMGYDFWDLIKERVFSLFLTDLPALYLHDVFYSRLLKEYNIWRFIYLTTASNIQVYIAKNKASDIESVEIQHGITFGADSKHFTGDKIVAWGKIPAEILELSGIDRDKITVGGWPPYINDSQNWKSKDSRSKINRILFLAQDADGLFLLNTTKTPQESFTAIFKALSQTKFSGKLIIRLHPRADKRLPFLISKKYNVSFDLSDRETLKFVVERSDLVIAQTTSAALDAIIMNKPVIYFPSMDWGFKFLDSSNTLGVVNSPGELAHLLSLGMKYDKRLRLRQKKFLVDYCNFGKITIEELASLVVGSR